MLFNQKFLAIAVFSVLLLGACKLDKASSILSVERSPKPLTISATSEAHPDRLIASKKLTGYFRQFIRGDYLYAKIKTETGADISFLIEQNEHCFLAEHQKTRLVIKYDVVDRYIPQAGGKYYPINLIRAIKTNQTNLATWQRSLTTEQLVKCRENSG
jgi:hypothetical protein